MHSVPPLAGLGLDVFLGFESCSSCRDGTSESSVSASARYKGYETQSSRLYTTTTCFL